MKKMLLNILFALVDIVCLLQGGILFTYSILNVSYKVEIAHGEGLTTAEAQSVPVAVGGYYFLPDEYIKVAVIGVALIITGLLMRNWRKTFE